MQATHELGFGHMTCCSAQCLVCSCEVRSCLRQMLNEHWYNYAFICTQTKSLSTLQIWQIIVGGAVNLN